MERERQRCEGKQADLDAQSTSNVALQKELLEAQHRVNNRDADVRRLEDSLAALKETMGAEYAAKARDHDLARDRIEELSRACSQSNQQLSDKIGELDVV